MSELSEIPKRFPAGTTVQYSRTYSAYPASAGWALKLYLNGKTTNFNKAAVADGDSFVITLNPADTASLPAGDYEWVEQVTKSSTEIENPAHGKLALTPNIATAPAGAFRTHAAKMAEAIEAHQLGRLTKAQEGYAIDGIQISNWDPADPNLEKARVKYLREDYQQRNGGGGLRTHRVRFSQES